MADSILKLRVESSEYDQKIKRAAEGIQRYASECRKVGGTLEVVEKDTLDFVKSLGRMETVSKTAKGGLGEMTKAFTDLKMQYKQLTDAEKQSPFGRELNNSLNQLKSRIIETKKDLKGIEGELNGSKFGQFGGIIDGIGHKIGITGNLTEMLTSKTALLTGAIGAGAAIVGKSAKEWAAYNAELAKQDQITTVTTGLKGDDANNMTDKMRALSDTYKVDFRDAINAANTLMSQFGESGESAIQLIKDGMQGMIQGDGPKLLSMIQQYAPAFRDAGVSASQLVAVIQNSEGGIFTDQNMQAIVMGIKNIRLMTNATSDALAKLGIDGQKMSEQMSNGSMTVFDALKQVAGELKNVDSNSKTAGEVMQTVFGRQGAMAGTNLAKAIEGLNTDLEQTKKQTGEVGDALADLQTANERLNIAIRDCFEYDGWDQMANGIKSNLITALAAVIEKLAEIRDFFTGENQIKWDIKTKPGVNNVADDPNVDANGNYIRKPNKGGTIKVVKQTVAPDPIIKPTKPTKPTGGGGRTTQKVEDIFPSGSLKDLQQQLQDLQKAQALVTDPTQWHAYQQAIDGVNEKITILKGNLPKDSRAEFRFETITDDVMAKLREVEGVHISTKPVTITADTSEAMDALKNVEGIHIDPKTLEIKADNAEALDKAKAINGVTVDDKTLRIVADTSEAMQQVQQLTSSIENQEVVIRPAVAFAKELPSLPTLVPKIEMPKMPDIKPLKMQIKAELDAQALKADEQTLNTILKDSIQNGINGMDLQFASLNDQIAKGINVPDEKWQAILDQYNKLREAIGKDPISIDFSTGNAKKNEERKGESDFDKGLGDMSKVVSGLSSVASGLQQMGIKLPEGVQKTLGVIQGLTSVIQGVNTIISVFSTSAETANTAAVTGNTVAMTALTAAVVANTSAMSVNTATNFIPFFAHGGLIHAATGYMVPGNDHADRTLIAASSGELILNRAQQGVIAGELEGGAGRSVHVTGILRGEDIVLVADHWGRRTGKGELAFWK